MKPRSRAILRDDDRRRRASRSRPHARHRPGELGADRCGNLEHGAIFGPELLEAPQHDVEEPLRQRLLDHAWRIAQPPRCLGQRQVVGFDQPVGRGHDRKRNPAGHAMERARERLDTALDRIVR